MTPAEMLICTAAFAGMSQQGNPKFNYETHFAIGQNICAASNKRGMDPKILGAYILTENARWEPFLSKAAAIGEDKGLYQLNSYYQRDRPNYALVAHPYYATDIAISVIEENLAKHPKSWKAIAAYWNPGLAEEGARAAVQYYDRWLMNFNKVKSIFENEASKQSRGIN